MQSTSRSAPPSASSRVISGRRPSEQMNSPTSVDPTRTRPPRGRSARPPHRARTSGDRSARGSAWAAARPRVRRARTARRCSRVARRPQRHPHLAARGRRRSRSRGAPLARRWPPRPRRRRGPRRPRRPRGSAGSRRGSSPRATRSGPALRRTSRQRPRRCGAAAPPRPPRGRPARRRGAATARGAVSGRLRSSRPPSSTDQARPGRPADQSVRALSPRPPGCAARRRRRPRRRRCRPRRAGLSRRACR